MKEGAIAFMTKPVQEDQFVAAVAGLVGPGLGARAIHVETSAATAAAGETKV
jgi:hypothetical protein